MMDTHAHTRRYHERVLSDVTDPLLAAVGLTARDPGTESVLYERDEEWSVALGSIAEIWVDGQYVHRSLEGRCERLAPLCTAKQALAVVSAALSQLPIDRWRAYGFASFDLACLQFLPERALSSMTGGLPLLHLRIPRVEVRLRRGRAFVRAVDPSELDAISDALSCARHVDRSASSLPFDERRHDADHYRALVERAVQAIHAREFQKVIVSRALPVDTPVDILATYVRGRRANQPARSFVVRHGALMAAGFSPETVAEVGADGRVSTQPLAGTRALVEDERENVRLYRELCSDDKEIAEHAASVKLACDEMGSVCRSGSVHVEEFMDVARRGSVQHLASRVVGRMRDDGCPWNILHALFPAVTASGIPKEPALRFIRANEPRPRGLYSGAVLVADADGSLDAALVLRSIFQQGSQTWLRAGAGIVAQSVPERELEETCEKLRSVSRFLVPAST